ALAADARDLRPHLAPRRADPDARRRPLGRLRGHDRGRLVVALEVDDVARVAELRVRAELVRSVEHLARGAELRPYRRLAHPQPDPGDALADDDRRPDRH